MSSIVGLMLATMVGLIILPRYVTMLTNGTHQAVLATTAGQFQMLLNGIQGYIDKHGTDLAASIPVGATTPIPISTLVAENDLPPGFGGTNPFGQSWQVYVSQPQSGALDAMVQSSGGTALGSTDEVSVASLTGAHGGFVPPNGLFNTMNAGTAYGASGSWQLPLGGLPNPGAGHLVGLLASANLAANNNDYLYRDAVPGQPNLNTMRTTLNMSGNNVQNANDVTASRGIFAGGNPEGAPGSVQVGSAYLYGDNTNAAIRMPGTLSIQHTDGTTADFFARNGIMDFGWFSKGLAVTQGNTFEALLDTNGNATFNNTVTAQNGVTVNAAGCNYRIANTCVYGDNSNMALVMPGAASIKHGDGSLADLDAHNVAANSVLLGTADGTASRGNGCSTSGAIATNTNGSGSLLVCMGGQWRTPPAEISSYVPTTTNNYAGYNRTNQITGTYSCPSGTQDLNAMTIWYGDTGYSTLHLCGAN